MIVSLLLLAAAGGIAAKQIKADAKSKRDCARYQSTIDEADAWLARDDQRRGKR